jgi:hypothetical protein
VDAVLPFEFTAAYDEASLQAATRILFRRNWKWQLPLTTGVVVGVLGTGVFLWNLRLHGLAWFCFAYPLLFPPLWMLSYWSIRRRLMMRLGKSVEVRMTAADFTIAWDGESHTFPWTRFKSALTDEHNLYLFLTKRTAHVVPTSGATPAAVQFAITRVGAGGTAV